MRKFSNLNVNNVKSAVNKNVCVLLNVVQKLTKMVRYSSVLVILSYI